MSEVLPFERVVTYQEWLEEEPEAENPSRLDVTCPRCEGLLQVASDNVAVGHWFYACPCGWNEFQ